MNDRRKTDKQIQRLEKHLIAGLVLTVSATVAITWLLLLVMA